ncbi:cytochrome c biogenesis CcdA family protein [Candidatus Magnetomonas plexicatena]|uniref:cytochrome c biogenesis CcdA family protein n=1 Tax=Candidatus Magnetomonas plexicatena TaxID=2552947 RepID=UPI001C77F9D0|nr:cytochrome c biogenesis protein CcdA [Nitrospirales bacterium LBB_01]
MDLSLLSVFTAGILAFLAPCVLPIVPAYLSFIAGVEGGSDSTDIKRNMSKTLIPICFFVLGFSVVFIIMGATATALGRFLVDYQQYINRIGGALVIFFGLHFTNLFLREDFVKLFAGIGLLIAGAFAFEIIGQQDFLTIMGAWAVVFALYFFSAHLLLYRQLKAQNNAAAGMFSSFAVGLTFGAGWSPCIGPILGSVLLLASRQDSVYQGMLFLAVFSLGLGIPFIVAGAFWAGFLNFVRKFGKFFALVEFVGGVLLITLGLLLLTGKLSVLSAW